MFVFVCWEIPNGLSIVVLGGGSGKANSKRCALVRTGLKWPSVAPPSFRHDHTEFSSGWPEAQLVTAEGKERGIGGKGWDAKEAAVWEIWTMK